MVHFFDFLPFNIQKCDCWYPWICSSISISKAFNQFVGIFHFVHWYLSICSTVSFHLLTSIFQFIYTFSLKKTSVQLEIPANKLKDTGEWQSQIINTHIFLLDFPALLSHLSASIPVKLSSSQSQPVEIIIGVMSLAAQVRKAF